MWKVGDLVDWDGTYPNDEPPMMPRYQGRVIREFPADYVVDWPNRKNTFHRKEGSARHFKLHVLDKFEETGIE